MKTPPSRHPLFCFVVALYLALAASSRSAVAPAPARTVPSASNEITGHDPIVLSPFEITTTQDEGYRSNNSASGSKTNTAIRETPQSIQIVNQSFMDDIQARSVADALLYTSGITEGQNPRGDRFEIRGFTTGIPFKNGFRDTGRAPRDTANFDRIEVAKGPASVIFSRTSAGGAVNILTKLPQPRPFVGFSATLGGYEYYRATLDLNGPLAGKNLLYRLNVAYQDSGSYRDFGFIHRQFVAPVFSWIIGPRTRLNVELEYLRDRRVNDPGIVAVGTAPLAVDPSTFYGDPDDVNRTEQISGRYELLHAFESGIAFRHAFRVNQTNEKGYETQFNAVNANTLLLTRARRYLVDENVDNFYVQTEASYELRATGGRHKLIAGFEVGYNFDGGVTDQAPMTATSVLAPDRGTTGAFTNNRWLDGTTWVNEYFLQDQFYLFEDKLALLAGARYARIENYNTNKRTNVKTDTKGDAPNPRFGIVWLPNDAVSVFANHSDLLTPQSGANPDGSTFDPVTVVLTEVGARLDVFNRRLTVTAGVYDLANTNIRNPDPDRPGFQIQTGEERTRGIEFDVVGRPLPDWQVIGSTNVSNAIISEDLGPNEGNRRANSPSHTYSLWNRYQFSEGTLKGLNVGLGVVRLSGRFGDVANSYYIPSYVRFDAALSYRTKDWDVALNIQNLADEDYIRAANGRLSIRPGSPRDFSLRFRWRK
jgi:iron complex outermembrane receptor protein